MKRFSTLSGRQNCRKGKLFGINFDILVFVDPSPAKSAAEGKASLHFNRRSWRSLHKRCHAVVQRLGEKGTFCIIIQKVKKQQGIRGWVRKSRIKGERKFDRDQSSEYLRHGNSCILRRNISSVSWVNIHFYYESEIYSIFVVSC